jgi:hypothetical protein
MVEWYDAPTDTIMDTAEERRLNHAAYRRLRDSLEQTYGRGRFVAFSGGQAIADAAIFEELCSLLAGMGKDPSQVLVVQAGIKYPETAAFFLPARQHE